MMEQQQSAQDVVYQRTSSENAHRRGSSSEEMYQRRKKRWESYGRATIAIGILGLITVTLFVLTRTNFSDMDHRMDTGDLRLISHQLVEVESVDVNQDLKRKVFKRSAELRQNEIIETNNHRQNHRKSYRKLVNLKDLEGEIKKLNASGRGKSRYSHPHSDGRSYYFEGYKCVPILKPQRYFEMNRNTQRWGTF